MKKLITVSTVTLVALTLLIGSVSSSMAGSIVRVNKNVFTSSKKVSSPIQNVMRAPTRPGLSGNDLKCALKYLDCLDGPLSQGVCQMLQTLCKADLGNLNSNTKLAPKSTLAPTPAKRTKFRYMGRRSFTTKARR